MKTIFVLVLLAFFYIVSVVAEFKSSLFNSAETLNIADGPEYNGKVYANNGHCSVQCLSEGCERFAVAETEGGGVHCTFDKTQEEMPPGRWNVYEKPITGKTTSICAL